MNKTSPSPTLVILAAGMGSRYKGLKQLDGFGPAGETIIDYTLYDAIKIGFGKVVFVIRKDFEEAFKAQYLHKIRDQIAVEFVYQELDNLPNGLTSPPQRTKPWGTGHALLICREVINESFVMVNADDLYGRSALKLVHDAIKTKQEGETSICLAGYSLKRTLSANGGVSRGICEIDEQSRLISIEEAIGIQHDPEGKITGQIDRTSETLTLSGEEVVSMNLIGMTPDLFSCLEAQFIDFYHQNNLQPKSEFYIPDFINQQLGKIDVRVLKTDSNWFGVTYRSDKTILKANLQKLASEGLYPDPLWK